MTQFTVEQYWQEAIQCHRAGRLADAERCCRQVILQRPRDADALHLLGVVGLQTGRVDMAVEYFRQAIAARPGFAQAMANLGNALSARGAVDEAIDAYRQAIGITPRMPEAHFGLGNALTAKGEMEGAIAAYREAVGLRPEYAKAHNNLGVALKDRGRNAEAISAFRRAIALNPNVAEAHYNLGLLLQDAKAFEEAIGAYRNAVTLKPQMAEYFCNMGVAMKEARKLDDAAAAFRQSIALNPVLPIVHCNLGTVLLEQGKVDEAGEVFRRAISLDSMLPETHNNLASVLNMQRRLDEALTELRTAAALSPGDAALGSNVLFTLEFHPDYSAARILDETRLWSRRHAEPLADQMMPHENDRQPGRRLRVGYVSPDFWSHCQSLFIEPLLKNHDRQAVEVFCYAHVSRPDAMTARLHSLADVWRNTLGQSDAEVAAQVRADKIDVLVDLTMHMANNRALMFARKPAPVQVCYLAYPGTTGMKAIDYRLTDPYLDPPGCDETVYAEKTVRLPETFWCYEPAEGREIAITPLPAVANGFVRFGCLSNIRKIGDEVLHLWAKVLKAVPGSRMLLWAPPGSVREKIAAIFECDGVERSRIEFVANQPRKKYLEEYGRIDIGLDCFPANGHTTSLDSFWMGVPVVTKVGKTVADRAGYCQLMNLKLPELIAQTPEEYVRIACELAGDLPQLMALRSGLRKRMEQSSLMDAPRFARHIETAYRKMWQAWCG